MLECEKLIASLLCVPRRLMADSLSFQLRRNSFYHVTALLYMVVGMALLSTFLSVCLCLSVCLLHCDIISTTTDCDQT